MLRSAPYIVALNDYSVSAEILVWELSSREFKILGRIGYFFYEHDQESR